MATASLSTHVLDTETGRPAADPRPRGEDPALDAGPNQAILLSTVNPAILRTYQYLVALVAIHMVVLGAANALRVVAELALGAPSGGFIGLPFLFAEGRARPLEIHREQMSLAIALLLVGIPAWYFHWRSADRAARRSEADRSAEWRSLYLHVVMAVTALLVLAYSARTMSLLLRAALFAVGPTTGFDLEPQWPARAAGAAAMAVTAAITWWWHARRSDDDRRAGVRAAAAQIRRFQTYAVLFSFAIVGAASAIVLVTSVWAATVGFIDFNARSGGPPFALGSGAPPGPDRARQLKEGLAGAAPPLALALLLGALYAGRAGRIARLEGPDGAAERGSNARTGFLYLLLFVAGTGALVALALTGATLLERIEPPSWALPLGPSLTGVLPPALIFGVLWLFAWLTAGREVRRSAGAQGPAKARRAYLYISLAVAEAVSLVAAGFSLQRLLRPLLGGPAMGISDFSTPAPFLAAFAGAWLFVRTVLRRESGGPETAFQAAARRSYSYLSYLAGVGAAAFGLAGAVGVAGSAVLGDNTHSPGEIALYLTLAVLGLITAGSQRALVRRTLDPSERSAPQRRLALSLAVFGGAGAVLVFGAGAVFRIVNAVLAVEFTTAATHDLWHLLTDTIVGLAVGLFHWRLLRADRALAAPVAAPPALVLVLPAPIEGMRDRLVRRFAGEGGRVFQTDAAGAAELVRHLESAAAADAAGTAPGSPAAG